MAVYTEHDGIRVIPLVSDDGGLTWYPKGGDPTKAAPADALINLPLSSSDAGATWSPKL